MEIITKSIYGIAICDSGLPSTLHNLNGPAYIIINDFNSIPLETSGRLQYYIYGRYIGTNLSNKEFERLKSIELKKRIFQ